MDDKLFRKRLEEMLEEGKDLGKFITLCMYEPKGIKVVIGKEARWLNKSEDCEIYNQLMKIYGVRDKKGYPRYSHGVCQIHRPLIGSLDPNAKQ